VSETDDLPPLRSVIEAYGLSARKSLGQNFLLDLNLTTKIARAAGPLSGFTVLEIGPGPGGLTRSLLAEGADRVVAVERDARCVAALEGMKARYGDRLEIVEADAVSFDPRPYLKDASVKIVANLPYNIGTQLLVDWLAASDWPPFFTSSTLMFQREVAERIVASPAQRKDYGRLAVLANWRCSTKILFNVPPSAFTPPPSVISSVVQLVPRPAPAECPVHLLQRVTAAAFGQRRKMLRQSLKALGDPMRLLAESAIDGTRRAEEIGIEDYVRLANALR
jgi:16S rRNA (adenine1518-N6/adenine1519-N6)-dimethyltransferase